MNNTILDSGNRTVFSTGAVRDIQKGKGRMDLLPMTALIELSKHCEAGAEKYGEHNVDKGMPQHRLCDSAMRHLVKYLRGDTDENHIRAAAWNIMWALEQSVTRPDQNDLYWNKNETQCSETEHNNNNAIHNGSETQHSETQCCNREHIQQRFERVM